MNTDYVHKIVKTSGATAGETVLDEKMADSFHIAIGTNNMFGGQNEAKIHMDFINSGRFELLPLE